MNLLGLVVVPIINLFNPKKRTGSLVRFWVLSGFKTLLLLVIILPLSACQHLVSVESPLPVVLSPPASQTTTPNNILSPTCDSQLDDNPCQSQPTKPFFILENWF